MRPLIAACSLLVLSACHASVDVSEDRNETGDNVHIAMSGGDAKDHVSIQVPGLSAKVNLPGLDLGGHIDMDGIAIAPRTDVKTVDVRGDDKSEGGRDDHLKIDFTNPGTPASLVDYYRKAATDAGYSGVTATAAGVSAAKGKKQFALSVSPEGSGSRGEIVMSGAD